jgi:hypothetical protein
MNVRAANAASAAASAGSARRINSMANDYP